MPECNPNLTPNVTHQPSLLGGAENMKLLFDDVMAHLSRARGVSGSHDNAWETLRFRIAQDAASLSHFVNMGTALAGQVGVTEGQQTVSPTRTGAADNLAAGAAPANRVVDSGAAVSAAGIAAAVAEAVQGNVTVQLGELTTAVGALAGNVTTALQALADSNALIASALSALKPTPAA